MEKPESAIALQAWLEKRGLKKKWFAEQVGTRPDNVSRWLSGVTRPHRATRVHIERITDGYVPQGGWGLAR